MFISDFRFSYVTHQHFHCGTHCKIEIVLYFLGGMLDSSWEHFAEALANATSSDGVLEALANISLELELKQQPSDATGAQDDNVIVCSVDDAHVFVARDTRSSGEYLAELAWAGIQALNAQVTDFGIMTTPQVCLCIRPNTTYPQYLSFQEPMTLRIFLTILFLASCYALYVS